MARCELCGFEAKTVSGKLGYCGPCLRERFEEVKDQIRAIHARTRTPFGLPALPPRTPGGLTCRRCLNACRLEEGQRGFCGLRENKAGRLVGGDEDTGRLSWYLDPLPTNCVAAWVCPGGGAGPGPKRGSYNLAVFYRACTFNCLFCQNWHYKAETWLERPRSAADLAAAVTETTACVCFFGGDPTPQVTHSLAAARLARGEGILRLCWETNGSVHPRYLGEMIDLALDSGGIIKFDLKAFSPDLHQALCGASNERTLANFAAAAAKFRRRLEPPLLVAATLLVPGYVDPDEVGLIARFIAGLDPDIPYALLAFYPHFYLDDLPTTSAEHARAAAEAARRAGLSRVRVGNVHLLGPSY